MLYLLQILAPDASWVTFVGGGWSWWWAKAGCKWWAFSGWLLARIPNRAVGAKGAVTANGMVETKGMLPLELSILNWLLDGITKGQRLVPDFRDR